MDYSKSPTKNWKRMGEVYKFFSRTYTNMNYSYFNARQMFYAETYGKDYLFPYYEETGGKCNGYAVGKHLMDIQLAMWVEDLSQFGQLTKRDLFLDKKLEPIRWFLMEFFGFTQESYDALLTLEQHSTTNPVTLDKELVYGYIRI